MNPLQENAHLFATPEGVFKIKSFGEIKPFTYRALPAIEYGEFDDNWGKCTLIARPIEDMTDEELSEFIYPALRKSTNYKTVKEDLIRRANEEGLSFTQAQRMLKKGVLPFPQDLFDDGTVIDSRTL